MNSLIKNVFACTGLLLVPVGLVQAGLTAEQKAELPPPVDELGAGLHAHRARHSVLEARRDDDAVRVERAARQRGIGLVVPAAPAC